MILRECPCLCLLNVGIYKFKYYIVHLSLHGMFGKNDHVYHIYHKIVICSSIIGACMVNKIAEITDQKNKHFQTWKGICLVELPVQYFLPIKQES